MNDLDKAMWLVNEPEPTNYQIYKDLNINQGKLSSLKSGRIKPGNLTYDTVMKMVAYYDEIKGEDNMNKDETFESIKALANYDRTDESSIGNHGFGSDYKLKFFKPVAEAVEQVFGDDYFGNIEGSMNEYDIVLSLWNDDFATGKRLDIKPGNVVKAWNGADEYMADTEHNGSLHKMLIEAKQVLDK